MKSKTSKTIVVLTVILLITSTFFVYFSTSTATEDEGWLEGYNYRKHHTVIGSSGAGYDYQLYFKVYSTSGVDSGSDVYLAGKCKADFSDVRFADTSLTPTVFPIWKASVSVDYAEFWVKVTTLDLNTNQTIAIYYGNADASDVSDGEATFEFFDGFNTLDGAKWNASGAPSVSGSRLLLDNSDIVWAKTAFGYGHAVMCKAQADEKDVEFMSWKSGAHYSDYYKNYVHFLSTDAANAPVGYATLRGVTCAGGDFSTQTIVDFAASDFRNMDYVYEVTRVSGAVKYYQNNVLIGSITTTLPTVDLYPGWGVWDTSQESTLSVDWVAVRKYVSVEPVHAEWTSEEAESEWTPEEPGTNLVIYWNTGGSGAVVNNMLVTTNGSAMNCYGNLTIAAIIKSSNYLYRNITVYNNETILASFESNPCVYSLSNETVAIWCYYSPVGGIQPYTNARFTFSPSGTTASFDGSLSTSNEPIYSYLWDFGDSTNATIACPNHTYSAAGTYSVTLTVTSDSGTDSITQTISVG